MLRALSALTVIILHITSNYLLRFKALLVINQLARFCVPAFIILSGFVLYKKDRRFHTRNDYLAFYKSRFYRILPPYFIWSFIYLAYRYMKNPEITMKRVLFDVATGQAYIHLYFLFILVQLYFLFPLLSELYKKHEKITTFTTLAITVIFQTFIYLDHLGYIVLPNLIIPYTRIFVPYLFYFVFGIYF
ncbi:MAG: acyltransferase, partial [Clostridiales bacterium]|nr:acyltransferase [Clostridiales bacterium]